MSRRLKSQWEFGELFPAEAVRKVLTVSEITGSIRRTLEKEIGQVWVGGEITNLRVQSSGHVYFSIKDATAQLSCVLFRTEAADVNRAFLTDGQKVVLGGELTVYEARGQYQLRVSSVQLQGVGALQAAFERLKQKLQSEGLFDPEHKRALPRFPRRIGLVTSGEGAAIRDVLHGIERRNPALEIIFTPCRVQGGGAAQELAVAVHALNEFSAVAERPLDLILVTRGGGSLEDLWAFNEEVLARAIYNSKVPVVSAVGHEIDFTISDFVADVRAATPTAAAEIITEGIFSRCQNLRDAPRLLREIVTQKLRGKQEQLRSWHRLLGRFHPRRRLAEQAQRLDDLHTSLNRCVRAHLRQKQNASNATVGRFARVRPDYVLERRREKLARLIEDLQTTLRKQERGWRQRLAGAETRLRLLSPGNVLNRGFSITRDAATGKIIRDPASTRPGQKIRSILHSGEISSTID